MIASFYPRVVWVLMGYGTLYLLYFVTQKVCVCSTSFNLCFHRFSWQHPIFKFRRVNILLTNILITLALDGVTIQSLYYVPWDQLSYITWNTEDVETETSCISTFKNLKIQGKTNSPETCECHKRIFPLSLDNIKASYKGYISLHFAPGSHFPFYTEHWHNIKMQC